MMECKCSILCITLFIALLLASVSIITSSENNVDTQQYQSDEARRAQQRGRRRRVPHGGSLELRSINIGGYSRNYSEKNYHFDRSRHQEKQINRTIQSETRVSFEKNAEGNILQPIGSHTLKQRNHTFIFPNGLNSSYDYNNITLFVRENRNISIDDTIHPILQLATGLTLGKNGIIGAYIPTRPHPCDQSSCYPATGNLLIGRESKLTATSTCGLQGEERYCIVSHLEDKKKCFRCDSRDRFVNNPGLSHRIDNILHRNYPGTQQRSWWQSENGRENVSIRLDLEAEFHFTHLIITFKTFRPAAMLIERSFDFGRTWKVYRYLAYDCEFSFPNIPKGPAKSITDVICESRYSEVQPSTEGEAIFRVLPRNILIHDPYSQEVQNLLKMTNLRINFTKLHTLGDDLLDRRQEIQEKYYYAIYEMVVRGSCSCYGHASRCLPGIPGHGVPFLNVEARPDMVHGRCECTHNTKGLNCEECEDFYRDLPWKPAIGKLTNACKRCNCNNHASSCHFESSVFEASGSVSGGVCDNCQHNTMGHKCELCKPFFYMSSEWQITDENACQSCDCDSRGSLDDGICDSKTDSDSGVEAGSCHCKRFVTGRRCDYCSNGYWSLDGSNPDGCKSCSCHLLGTVGNQGCNVYTGECTCKHYVTGRDCNQCLPEYWGLSEDKDGCKPCECDVGGAYDNSCDVLTGQCRCRPHISSRNCSIPEQGYFAASLDHLIYEAELAQSSPNCQVIVREPYRDGRKPTWTGVGFVRTFDESHLEFTIDNIISSMDYDLVIRYEPQHQGWQQANIIVTADSPPDPDGPCANSVLSNIPSSVLLRSEAGEAIVYPPVCLERGKSYRIRLEMQSQDRISQGPSATVLIDSIALIPRMDGVPFFHGNQLNDYRKQLFDRYRCGEAFMSASKYPVPEDCKKLLYSVGYNVFDGAFECGCNPTGSTSSICDTLGGQCQCKLNVVGRTCERCAPGTYGFSPEGCRPCECNPIGSLDNFCDSKSGQCRCRPNTYGIQCDQCQPGYWNFPNCQRCNCNGHADICDSSTGTCINCRDFSTGSTCDRCVEGYYGDPRLGINILCRPCPCPGTLDSSHSFATRCALDRITNDVICECQEGYSGPRCDTCADNYYGSPETPGGRCKPCSCNNNIDISRPGNCDLKTGECLQCLFSTEGFTCENCKSGYYGDAVHQMCRNCVCNILGTNANIGSCNQKTGQCPCHPNVIGLSCDQCKENHWKIASGEGCEPCDCDGVGSQSTQCNLYDGQCECKSGFGGRKCDQCESNFWGNPALECFPCECNLRGSATMQCDRTNGSCVCLEGIGGSKCDECARGHIGHAPSCSPCGECFENWDRIIGDLKGKTARVVEAASQIKQKGATGAYTREFETMQTRIDEVKNLLQSSSVSSSDIEELQGMVEDRMKIFANTSLALDSTGEVLANVSQRILLANVSLEELERKVDSLQASANALKGSAINLQEANIEGALNLTREAKKRSDAAVRRADGVQRILTASERQRRRIDQLLNQIGPQNKRRRDEVTESLGKLEDTLNNINDVFPELNTFICDKAGNPCDSHCGGAGCGVCGGISCEGAVSTSEAALKYAQDAYTDLKRKDADAEDLLRSVTQTKAEVDEAKREAEMAFDAAEIAKNKSDTVKTTLQGLEKEIKEFLSTSGNTPSDIRTLAQEVLSKNITLRPEQIDELVEGIRESLSHLDNIDDILRATAYDLYSAETLKQRAEEKAAESNKVLQDAVQVRYELEKAKEAQRNAESAIEKAKEDITAADIDLKQIGSETTEAERQAGESKDEAERLKKRLEELERKILQKERKRTQATKESNSALQNATAVQDNADRLKIEYEKVSKALQDKQKNFDEAKEKDWVQTKANRLASNVNEKLKELKGIEKDYTDHDRRIEDVLRQIASMTDQMEVELQMIRNKEEYHRTCTP